MAKNKLIVIGWLYEKIAYLNIDKDEAIKRYLIENPENERFIKSINFVEEINFNDEFNTYDIWIEQK